MKVRFLAKIDHAVTHYNAQTAGLGTEFAVAVRDGLTRMQERPKAWQLIGRRVRRYRLSRFPYGIVYAPLPNEIVVVAVMHLRRNPGYWRERLRSV